MLSVAHLPCARNKGISGSGTCAPPAKHALLSCDCFDLRIIDLCGGFISGCGIACRVAWPNKGQRILQIPCVPRPVWRRPKGILSEPSRHFSPGSHSEMSSESQQVGILGNQRAVFIVSSFSTRVPNLDPTGTLLQW